MGLFLEDGQDAELELSTLCSPTGLGNTAHGCIHLSSPHLLVQFSSAMYMCFSAAKA